MTSFQMVVARVLLLSSVVACGSDGTVQPAAVHEDPATKPIAALYHVVSVKGAALPATFQGVTVVYDTLELKSNGTWAETHYYKSNVGIEVGLYGGTYTRNGTALTLTAPAPLGVMYSGLVTDSGLSLTLRMNGYQLDGAEYSFARGEGTVPADPTAAVALHLTPGGVSPSIVFLFPGTEVTLTLDRVRSDSVRLGPPSTATWKSDNEEVAVVSAAGVVHAHCAGETIVRASASEGSKTLTGAMHVSVATAQDRCER